jgi:hypothetical protein
LRLSLCIHFLLIVLCFASCTTNTSTGLVEVSPSDEKVTPKKSSDVVFGALVGSYLGSHELKNLRSSPRTVQRMDRGEPLTLDDIIKLHEGCVSDQTIIRYIHDSQAVYSLTESNIRRLRSSGMSEAIIVTMRRKEG